MSDEHGWPDFADHHGDHIPHHEDLPDTSWEEADHTPAWEDPAAGHLDHGDHFGAEDQLDDHHAVVEDVHQPAHDDAPADDLVEHHPIADITDGHVLGPIGADPDATAEHLDDPVTAFPPLVDVGPLPEPVDGFPWIDTGSLGVVDPVTTPVTPVTATELAAYAAEDLPPGADPWAALAGSEDPATSALARWWSENG
ncbi:hypothetical protein GCM10010435_30290 [Winogradskya consettensis]|uniref:Uncharacterized protein n=1 Tax=Winogradskya consettensis TaxID=113560 RepID=A0A919SF00_9ACTN|nr:hypothetical protein [Actinoplanes consettensis]GIM70611.1 hypothetical protein Aco04nite_21210 [Actinoplanes consettensis]